LALFQINYWKKRGLRDKKLDVALKELGNLVGGGSRNGGKLERVFLPENFHAWFLTEKKKELT